MALAVYGRKHTSKQTGRPGSLQIHGQQLRMVTPYCRKSYSVSLVGLILITISHLILDPPSPLLFLSHFGCNLLPLHWQNRNHQRRFPPLCVADSTNPPPLLLPLRRLSLLLSKASSLLLCSGSPPSYFSKDFDPEKSPLSVSSVPPQLLAISIEIRCYSIHIWTKLSLHPPYFLPAKAPFLSFPLH